MAKDLKPNQVNVSLDDAAHDRVLVIAEATGNSAAGAAGWCVREGLPHVENKLDQSLLANARKVVEAKKKKEGDTDPPIHRYSKGKK